MYNEKLIEISEIYKEFKDTTFYKVNNVIFRIMNSDEEYVSWRLDYDIFWNWEKSKEFYNRMSNPIQLIVLDKRPKELKGKKKIATINKDKDYKIQVFVDDEYNLYYQDNHAFMTYKSKLVDNQYGGKEIESWLECSKCWFKITGLYQRRKYHILAIIKELNEVSEKLYSENTVSDNVALDRLYQSMLNEYMKYIKKNN